MKEKRCPRCDIITLDGWLCKWCEDNSKLAREEQNKIRGSDNV